MTEIHHHGHAEVEHCNALCHPIGSGVCWQGKGETAFGAEVPTAEATAFLTARAIHHPGICPECDAVRSVLKALSASQEPHRTRYEYRAWIRRPWSILDPEKYRERGWMEAPVDLKSKDRIKDVYEIKRSEETHAYVHRWERRELIEGPWEEDPS